MAVIAASRSCGASSLPRARLMAISQTTAADINGILAVANGLTGRFGKELRIVEPPEEDVSIEEERHCGSMPKAAAMSSGRASRSSAMRTRPFHWPPTRGESSAWKGRL